MCVGTRIAIRVHSILQYASPGMLVIVYHSRLGIYLFCLFVCTGLFLFLSFAFLSFSRGTLGH